jgi:hypothetical protein
MQVVRVKMDEERVESAQEHAKVGKLSRGGPGEL